ncbi:hypothetical protein J5275_29930, partial [Rhizobium sp. L245/93]|nr:hypothetical protein [Rhizobium sp. L245/93]
CREVRLRPSVHDPRWLAVATDQDRQPPQRASNLRVKRDYYLPLVDGMKDFVKAPHSVHGAMISLGYNIGAAGARSSSSAKDSQDHDYYIEAGNYVAWAPA